MVGRQPGCDVLVKDHHVSALHCCIWAKEGKGRSGEKPAENSDSDLHGDSKTKSDSDIHGDSKTKGDKVTCGDSDVQGSSDIHGDGGTHSDGNTGCGSDGVAYVVDLSTNGTWVERMDQPSSSSGIAAKRVVKKESVPLRVGDVIHLKSPLMFPPVNSCSLKLRRCGKSVCVAAASNDVATSVITFVPRGDREQVDRSRTERVENDTCCLSSPKRAKCNDDSETTTVPDTDNTTTGDSQFECCPVCMQLLAISDLIEHAPKCAGNEGVGDTSGECCVCV